MIAMPKPRSTLGTLVALCIDPESGLADALEIAENHLLLRPILQRDLNGRKLPVLELLKVLDEAFSLENRTISIFSFEAGTSTKSCFAEFAFRILVSRSATGSVTVMLDPPSYRAATNVYVNILCDPMSNNF